MSRRRASLCGLWLLVGVFAGTLILPGAALAESCCSVTAIDQKSGVVSARENATGRAFQFKVGDGKLLGSLRPGHPVYANFKTNQVSLDGKTACCSILTGPTDSGERTPESGNKQAAARPTVASKGGQQPQPTPIRPTEDTTEGAIRGKAAAATPTPTSAPAPAGTACCAITGLYAKGGTVSARATATGQAFSFAVTDRGLFDSLKVGQPVYANFKTGQVSLDGRTACCAIVNALATGGVPRSGSAPGSGPIPTAPPPPPAPTSTPAGGSNPPNVKLTPSAPGTSAATSVFHLLSVQSIVVSPSEGPGGVEAHGTVTLSSSAPNTALSGTQHGVYVVLTSNPPAVSFNSNYPDNPYYASSGLFIPAGATQGRFNVIPQPVSSETSIVFSASVLSTAPATVNFRVRPPMLQTIRLNQSQVSGGTKVHGNATFDAPPAPADAVVVQLTSSNPSAVSVPPTVTLEQGKTVEPFDVQTGGVSVRQDVTISASYAGMSSNTSVGWKATLSLIPPVLAHLGLSGQPNATNGFGCYSPGLCSLSVFLTGQAPPGGALVYLFSDGNPNLSIPKTVTVPEGKEFADFQMTVILQSSAQTVKVSASYNQKSVVTDLSLERIIKWDLVMAKVVLKDRFGNVISAPADDTPFQLCPSISNIGGVDPNSYYPWPNLDLPLSVLHVSYLVHGGGPVSAGKDFDVPVSFLSPEGLRQLGNVEYCFQIGGMPTGSTMDVTLTADAKKQVDESNEGNNVHTLTIKRP